MTKVCTKCGIDKDHSDYGPMLTGKPTLRAWCRVCTNIVAKTYRITNRRRLLKRRRADYYANHESRKADLRRRNNARPKSYGLAASRLYAKRHPIKYRCRQKTQYAIVTGELKKLPCEVCGDTKVEGHHEDYRYHLQVRWLCRTHHRALHQKYNVQAAA